MEQSGEACDTNPGFCLHHLFKGSGLKGSWNASREIVRTCWGKSAGNTKIPLSSYPGKAQHSANAMISANAKAIGRMELLWMDEILHHLRNPGMMLPCKYQQTMVSLGFKAVQDFVHPQYGDPVRL